MNKKILALRGIPASWKSTFAKEEVKKGAVRFNKDDIRKEIEWRTYSKKAEEEIIQKERNLVIEAINKGEEYIIIDNTHLWNNNKHIAFYKDLAQKNWYDFEIRDFYVKKEEAIKRDKDREDSVWEEVIEKLIKISGNWGLPRNPEFREDKSWLPPAYIFDIDWTVAFMDWERSPYDYSKVRWDRPNIFLRELIHKLCEDNVIIFLSWRDWECEELTRQWLRDNLFPCDFLFMRTPKDRRKDTIVKKEIYKREIEDKFSVRGVFDDRDCVVDLWRLDLKLPCYQVFYWDF